MPYRLACFTSHVRGQVLLRTLFGLEDLIRVVLIATDDPRSSYSNAHLRIWRYWSGSEIERLRRLVPDVATEHGHEAFTGRVRPENGVFRRMFEGARPDAIVCSVFGQRLPRWMLDAVEGRAWNLHDTIPGEPLAYTRGPQPYEKAYRVGAPAIEMLLHQMSEEYDDGAEVGRSGPFPLPPIGEGELDAEHMLMIQEGTAPLGAELLKKHLPGLLG